MVPILDSIWNLGYTVVQFYFLLHIFGLVFNQWLKNHTIVTGIWVILWLFSILNPNTKKCGFEIFMVLGALILRYYCNSLIFVLDVVPFNTIATSK